MTLRCGVLLITKDDATVNMVRSALNGNQLVALGNIYKEVSELRTGLLDTPAQAVVVDIDPDPIRILYDVRTVVNEHPQTRLVVLSSTVCQELLLEAMQAGARHFLQKQSIASELDQVLERLLCEQTDTLTTRGSVISIFSASGGCGATTVALNLANEFRLLSADRVLLIDLDDCYGALATYLGISGQYGIADILDHNGPIDEHLIESITCNYMEDFHVLISPVSVENRGPPPRAAQPINATVPATGCGCATRPGERGLKYRNLAALLKAARQGYGYIIIDAPRVPESTASDLATLSRFTLIVFQLTIKDLRSARSMVSFLTDSGIAREKVKPLANRCRRRGPLVRLADSQQALGGDSVHRIRSDWRKAMNCVNRGQLLAQVAPRSGLRRDFRRLAAEIDASQTER